VTFIEACKHITNFQCGHESRTGKIGKERLSYPDGHYIEADCRLSWFLGQLDEKYGDRARYVHLKRDNMACAVSYSKRIGIRYSEGIMGAFKGDILLHVGPKYNDLEISLYMIDTVNRNIQHFLKDKTHVISFQMENCMEDWPMFWKCIGAQGNFEASLREWDIKHNVTTSDQITTPHLKMNNWKSHFKGKFYR